MRKPVINYKQASYERMIAAINFPQFTPILSTGKLPVTNHNNI